MSEASPIWVWTPLFSRSVAPDGFDPGPDIRIIRFDPSDPEKQLLSFRRIREDKSDLPVTIFDVARFLDDRTWAYVADGVNRSGKNPLRGLGSIAREPFIDLCRLYHVPAGYEGIEAVFLGKRYTESVGDVSGSGKAMAVCSHLHDAAILAHAEGFNVTGVLVAESYVLRFDFRQVL